MSAESTEVITAAEIRQAGEKRTSLIEKMANKYGLEPNRMMATLKATAFKGEVTNEQMAALLIVADQHGLNPWTKELYAFPSRQGIVPVVSVDGWARIANSHPAFNGMTFDQTDTQCTCTIYRKDRDHPIVVTEYLEECKRPTDPWTTHPKRMLRHKAMIQCARLAFSFSGIYDADEAERIVEAEINVTPGQETLPTKGKVAPKKLREVVEGLNEATAKGDGKALWAVWRDLDSDQQLYVWDQLRSWERSAIKALLDASKQHKYGDSIDAWALEAMKQCKDPATLESVWKTIQDAYSENDAEVPADIETVHTDRKAELGVVCQD